METPPPITKISGFTTAAIPARVFPRIFPKRSATSIASSSPSFTASNTVLAEILPLSLSTLGLSSSARRRFARRTIPVAEVYCSRHPQLPQLQASVSSSITWICPISPPAPVAPERIFPSTMIPPPTPVPSVTATTLEYPWPPPFHISPRAATFASLPASTGRFRRLCSSFFRLKVPQPRFTAT